MVKFGTKYKMCSFLFRTCIRTCSRNKNGLRKYNCSTKVSLVDLRSHAQQHFLGHDQHYATNFIEKTVGAKISRNEGWMTLICGQKVDWFGSWRKASSSKNFHRNFAISRKFHISSHPSSNNSKKIGEWKEDKIFTVPNILCFGRILASPILGYFVLSGNYLTSLIILLAAGFTDVLDGFIARKYPSQMSYLGSVLDPIADKILVGVLTVSLSIAHLIPVPLAIIILGRDIGLIFASFVVRFVSLPAPKTFMRFFDFQLPTVQVTPSLIGKVNTALQLALISLSLAAPILDITEHSGLLALQYTVGVTTIVSGLDYFITRRGFSVLGK
ncbi:probable cardiolipin synthase (CMP-forming) [Dendronephthya gigantea]|uniref:probable cardiolipin synthase (CMP-forming) n=1 Tax=Dendronephthya gigantea TaxID=151771 RepID=UPI00106A9285|nr:probable cardiolipin synthase (CMP-forming) [Dendronephthya gigantea]